MKLLAKDQDTWMSLKSTKSLYVYLIIVVMYLKYLTNGMTASVALMEKVVMLDFYNTRRMNQQQNYKGCLVKASYYPSLV